MCAAPDEIGAFVRHLYEVRLHGWDDIDLENMNIWFGSLKLSLL